ncbi:MULTISPECIES: hypothetical protein [Sphingobacterium]|nr:MULTISPECIES: hypothetical protein [Sphingobacterium]
MKHKIITSRKDFQLETQDQKSANKLHHSDEGSDSAHIFWFAYGYNYAFMPMVDLTFAFDELKKIVKPWLVKRKKYINKTDETI